MKQLEYRGFVSTPEFSQADQVWFGKIDNTDDLVTYEANDKQHLEQEFKDAVDDYLEPSFK